MNLAAKRAYSLHMLPNFGYCLPRLILPRTIEDMDILGYRLHSLQGNMKNRWSISVSGNWRLTFEFKDGNVYLPDYEDYH